MVDVEQAAWALGDARVRWRRDDTSPDRRPRPGDQGGRPVPRSGSGPASAATRPARCATSATPSSPASGSPRSGRETEDPDWYVAGCPPTGRARRRRRPGRAGDGTGGGGSWTPRAGGRAPQPARGHGGRGRARWPARRRGWSAEVDAARRGDRTRNRRYGAARRGRGPVHGWPAREPSYDIVDGATVLDVAELRWGDVASCRPMVMSSCSTRSAGRSPFPWPRSSASGRCS